VLDFLCVWVFGGRIRKAGPSKQSGGLFARPWLARRRANPSSPTKNRQSSVEDWRFLLLHYPLFTLH